MVNGNMEWGSDHYLGDRWETRHVVGLKTEGRDPVPQLLLRGNHQADSVLFFKLQDSLVVNQGNAEYTNHRLNGDLDNIILIRGKLAGEGIALSAYSWYAESTNTVAGIIPHEPNIIGTFDATGGTYTVWNVNSNRDNLAKVYSDIQAEGLDIIPNDNVVFNHYKFDGTATNLIWNIVNEYINNVMPSSQSLQHTVIYFPTKSKCGISTSWFQDGKMFVTENNLFSIFGNQYEWRTQVWNPGDTYSGPDELGGTTAASAALPPTSRYNIFIVVKNT